MQIVWRITTRRFQDTAFSGEGARLYGGRWNPPGFELVYTSESRSLALLEMLVQDDPLRADYVLIPARLPIDVRHTVIEQRALPADWRTLDARDSLRSMGVRWLQSRETAVLSVPSAVLPGERNYLLNPHHPDFAKIQIGCAESLQTDLRLFRSRGASSD